MVQIIYKHVPEIFIADRLSLHNHEEGKDKPIKDIDIRRDSHTKCDRYSGMHLDKTNSADASVQDEHLQHLKKQYNCRLAKHKG